jgi:hypothetical protein
LGLWPSESQRCKVDDWIWETNFDWVVVPDSEWGSQVGERRGEEREGISEKKEISAVGYFRKRANC